MVRGLELRVAFRNQAVVRVALRLHVKAACVVRSGERRAPRWADGEVDEPVGVKALEPAVTEDVVGTALERAQTLSHLDLVRVRVRVRVTLTLTLTLTLT